MKRLISIIIILIILFSLSACKFSPQEEITGNETNFVRWTEQFDEKELTTEYLANFAEDSRRNYYGNIQLSMDSGITSLYQAVEAQETIEDLHKIGDSTLQTIKDTVDTLGTFEEMEWIDYNGMIQIVGMTTDKQVQYSVNIYLEGNIQAVGYYTWGGSFEKAPDPDEVCGMFKEFIGLDISKQDLLKLNSAILENAQENGTYTYVLNDALTMNYIALSVYNFGTTNEYWQCYASVNIK